MPMETQCRARPESICGGREGTWEQLGAQKRKIAVPSMPSEPVAGGGREHGSNWGPRNGRSQCLACRPSRPRPWKPDAGQGPNPFTGGGREHGSNWGPRNGRSQCHSMPSEPAPPMETRCRARPESIYRAAGPGPCASRARGQATLGSGKGCRVGSQDRGREGLENGR